MVRGGHHVPVSDFDAAITMALSLGFLFRAAMITFIAPALTSERFSPSGGNTSEFLEQRNNLQNYVLLMASFDKT